MTVNYRSQGEGTLGLHFPLTALGAGAAKGEEAYIERVKDLCLEPQLFSLLEGKVKYLAATPRFKDVIQTFAVPAGETPAGFRIESTLQEDGLLLIDLVRDISYDKNGVKRPTGILYSADSANPYEVAPIAPLLANLTCNPGIVYDLFINNPKANVGNAFHTRDEVMTELGRILGPGCDISVELNNPFEEDFDKILEECETFKSILSEYRSPTPALSTPTMYMSCWRATRSSPPGTTRRPPRTPCAATIWHSGSGSTDTASIIP